MDTYAIICIHTPLLSPHIAQWHLPTTSRCPVGSGLTQLAPSILPSLEVSEWRLGHESTRRTRQGVKENL